MPVTPAAQAALRLHLADGVGSVTFHRLVERFGTVEAAAQASPSALMEVKGVGPKIAEQIFSAVRDPATLDAELSLADKLGISILCERDLDYPAPLRHISDPPAVLYVRGTLQPEDAVALAIVGMREPSRYGLEQAERFAMLAAGAGLTVVSGLARGIDAAAHRGALRAGGRTLAVLGNGLATVYPPEHVELADEIVKNGALVSELPLNTRPDVGTFPVRNRLIAGLTLGTMVVEGNVTSGSLITARLATDYNREVFALPGRIDNARALGPNTLIKRGEAAMVLDWPDVLDGLGDAGAALRGKGPRGQRSPNEPAEQQAQLPLVTLTGEEQTVFDVLSAGEAGADEIIEKTGLAVPKVLSALTMLQIKGLVGQKPGPVFERRAPS